MHQRNSDETLYELVATLASNAAETNLALRSRGEAELSVNGPTPDVPLTDENKTYHDARASAIEAAEKIIAVLRGPREVLLDISFQHCATASLQVIQYYRIQDFVPLNGSTTYKKIATSIGKNITEAIVERVVQHAISFGLFDEDSEGNVRHNAVSALLVTDPDLENWVYLCTNVAYKAGAHIPQAIDQYGASSEADETGYSVSIGRKISQFSHLRETEGGAAMFAGAMKGISAGGAYDVTHALDGYPWAKLAASPNPLVVDVGGGPGHVAVALAKLHPSLAFEVQDLPETVEVGAKNCPPELQDRITFQSHDFFQVQPAREVAADGSITYFARFILHDWSDLYAQKILDALAKSLRPQDRIILNEVVVPAPGELPLGVERRLRDRDLLMLMNLNGRERTVSAFNNLFNAVEPKLRLEKVYRPPRAASELFYGGNDAKLDYALMG